MNALLIEDEPVAQALTATILEAAGYTPCIATSLSSALVAIANNRFDLIMVDLVLPDSLDPLVTARAVIEASGGATIVVLTGNDDYRTGVEILRMGADEFVVKGSAMDELPRRLERAIVQKRESQKLQSAIDELRRLRGETENVRA